MALLKDWRMAGKSIDEGAIKSLARESYNPAVTTEPQAHYAGLLPWR